MSQEFYTAENLAIVSRIVKSNAFKHNADVTRMQNYAMSRFDNCIRNFNPTVGTRFSDYLKTCMRGYCLNYIRDRSFMAGISQKEKNIYLHYCKHHNTALTALNFGISEYEVWATVKSVKNRRESSNVNIDDAYDLQSKPEISRQLREALTLLSSELDDEDFTLMYDHYVKGKEVPDAKQGQIDLLTTKIKSLVSEQVIFL